MKAILLVALIGLAGCSTLPSTINQLENRVAVTADCTQALFISKYGRIGIAAEIAPADGDVIAKNLCKEK